MNENYKFPARSMYTHELLKLDDSWFMKQNADFQDGFSQAQSTATPLPILEFLTTYKSFQMSRYIRIFFKGHQNGQRTKFYTLNFIW